ncbi:hypothetical protein GGR57DRAFT_367788 [Xylariaceae sp. FL1272]|nr:hypothetical protein GGR57DRAFT_367788 [Xylariaceae sp. FL1272]
MATLGGPDIAGLAQAIRRQHEVINAVVETLNAVVPRLESFEANMNRKIKALETRVHDELVMLETRVRAESVCFFSLSTSLVPLFNKVYLLIIEHGREHNNRARMRNSTVKARNLPIALLHSVRTNSVIAGFPRTIAEMNTLNDRRLNAIFEELDAPQTGDLAQKRMGLKALSGVGLWRMV